MLLSTTDIGEILKDGPMIDAGGTQPGINIFRINASPVVTLACYGGFALLPPLLLDFNSNETFADVRPGIIVRNGTDLELLPASGRYIFGITTA